MMRIVTYDVIESDDRWNRRSSTLRETQRLAPGPRAGHVEELVQSMTQWE